MSVLQYATLHPGDPQRPEPSPSSPVDWDCCFRSQNACKILFESEDTSLLYVPNFFHQELASKIANGLENMMKDEEKLSWRYNTCTFVRRPCSCMNASSHLFIRDICAAASPPNRHHHHHHHHHHHLHPSSINNHQYQDHRQHHHHQSSIIYLQSSLLKYTVEGRRVA